MGWSGWDMPKEHKNRKNRSAFGRRKTQVDLKLRTQGKLDSYQLSGSDTNDNLPGTIEKRKREHSAQRWGRYLLYTVQIVGAMLMVYILYSLFS